MLKSAAFLAAGLIALAGCQKSSVNAADVVAEMKRGTSDLAAAYNAGNADAIAAKYSADAVVMAPGEAAVIGPDEIREFMARDSAAAKAAGLTLVIDEGAGGASGDLAWHSGSYKINDASGAAVVTGNYVEVQQNVDGKWMIIRDIWNSDQAPAPAAEAVPAAEAAPAT